MTLFVFLATIVFAALMMMWNAFVGMTLWNWFIPDFIEGAPHLGWVQCMGVMIVCSFFFKNISNTKNQKNLTKTEQISSILFPFVFSTTMLLMGWVVKSLM